MRVVQYLENDDRRFDSTIETTFDEAKLLQAVKRIDWLRPLGPCYVEKNDIGGYWYVLHKSGVVLAIILER